MSIHKKLREVATAAATEAVARERARCLWVLDDMVSRLEKEVHAKILLEAQRHTTEVKLRIARVIVMQAKRAILTNRRPEEAINILNQPVQDVAEMSRRIENLTNLLTDVGFDGVMTINDIRMQLKVWDEQEGRIDELEARLIELDEK